MKVGVALVLVTGLSACTIGDATVAKQASQISVHAVLDPASSTQEILVERTLTGSINIIDNVRFDPLDPINTGEGSPIVGAIVTITGSSTAVSAFEVHYTNKDATYGAGRYVASTTGTRTIRAGGSYTLTVRTPDGSVVTGRTYVPAATPVSAVPASTSFDRERDTLRLTWPASGAARSYGLRVESPFGALLLFTDSTKLRLPGTISNVFASNLQRVFVPGFLQTSIVFAVDTNYYDYYRSRNDPFTGSGIINHLEGGIGLFGAAVIVDSRIVDVTQPTREPAFEGTWQAVRVGIVKPVVDNFKVYVESTGQSSTSLSGSYIRDATLNLRDGMAGARDGSRIELQFLNNQDIHQTYMRFVGVQMADSLVGAYTNSTTRVVFKKR